MIRRVVVGSLCLAATAAAQERSRIEDNSFLLEEAFNQERGVVQHISAFSRARTGGLWGYTLTTEWPLRGQRHQLSYTTAVERSIGPGGAASTGLGDVAVNYRYQALGGDGRSVWMAPRLTVLLPVGSADRGRGSGGLGVEAAVPISVELAPWLTSHFNAGLLVNPGARARGRAGVVTSSGRLGGSLIADVTPRINLLIESVWESSREVVTPSTTLRAERWVVSPGVRWAYDLASGLQIVPGVAYTVSLDPADDSDEVFLYLSFEYPFRRSR